MSEIDEQRLRDEILSAAALLPELAGIEIRLDHGSDVTDLRMNVDVRVRNPRQQTSRVLSFISVERADQIIAELRSAKNITDQFHYVNYWMIIVKEISGPLVAEGIRRYVHLQSVCPQGW